MRFVHAADLHIDSPLVGLERYEGAPVSRVREATRDAFRNVVGLCLEEEARFLVLAGDVFDADWRDVNTGLFFVKELSRLRAVGCEVLLLRGNHDFDLTSKLDYPEHVHEFAPPGKRAARGARSHVFEADGIAFHGVSYPTRQVEESLLPSYPEPLSGILNVGVLHTNATGNRSHESYAPCSVSDLVAKGYGYWALGHVHSHAVLHDDPFVVYPGNTQGRSAREAGAKGCVVAEVDDEGRRVERVRFAETDVMRYFVEAIRLDPDDDRDALIDRVRAGLDAIVARADGRLAAVRLVISGSARAHKDVATARDALVAQIRSEANDRGDAVWLERVDLATSPAIRIDELRESKGLLGELLRHIEHLRTDDGEPDLLRVASALAPLEKKIARDVGLHVSDRAVLERILAQAEALLAERLNESALDEP